MDIAHIEYKGKQYPIRISYYVMKMLKAKTGKNIEELGEDMALYEDLLYYALESGAKYTGVEMKLNLDEMEDALDHCFLDFVALIPQFFAKKKKEPEPIAANP